MKIEHALSPAYQQHAGEVLQQISDAENAILNFEGHILRLKTNIETMRAHLGVLVGIVEKAEALPASLTPYALSSDGRSVIGEVADPEPPPVAQEPAIEPVKTEVGDGLAR